MTTFTPFETAWPAGLALLALVGAAAAARRHLRPGRGDLAVFAAALAVRLFALPALSRHLYDGHEAEYWDLFRGLRAPTRGGTVLYPAMQWGWWLLGRVLPHDERVPVVVAALAGAAAVAVAAAALRALGGREAGRAAAAVLVLHPAQAAWSSSAYNVVFPELFAAIALWAGARLAADRRPSAAVAALGAAAGVLAVATRLDAAAWLLPAGLVALADPRAGRGAVLRAAGLPLLAGLALAARAAWPLVWPGELPGAGERGLAFSASWDLLAPLHPFDGVAGLAVLAVGAAVVLRRRPAVTAALVGSALAGHLVLATFDDYGERHAVGLLPGVAWAVSAGGAWPAGLATLVPALVLEGVDLAELRGRYYGPQEAFEARLAEAPWAGLPRVGPAAARPDGCGWIAEDPRVAAEPPRSHFNVLDPREAAALRGPDGCLRWCLDLQDWRWSSRGVRDRALRLAHLYELETVAVLEIPEARWSCLVVALGARRPPGLSRLLADLVEPPARRVP